MTASFVTSRCRTRRENIRQPNFFGIVVKGLRILAPDVVGPVGLALVSGKTASTALVGCSLKGLLLEGGRFRRHLQSRGFGGDVRPHDYSLRDSRFCGAVLSETAMLEAGDGNQMRNLSFESGEVTTKPTFHDNDLGGVRVYRVAKDALQGAGNRVEEGPNSPRPRR